MRCCTDNDNFGRTHSLGDIGTRPSQVVGERARRVVERQVPQMTRLVDDLTDAARVVRGEVSLRRQPAALADIVDHAVEVRRRQMEQRLGSRLWA